METQLGISNHYALNRVFAIRYIRLETFGLKTRCSAEMRNKRLEHEKTDPSRVSPNQRRHERPQLRGDARRPGLEASGERVSPQPLGDKCSTYCPLFTCTRNAVFMVNKPVKGRMIRVAQCRLTGGDCISGECQYASCRINALLPDGKCSKAIEKKVSRVSDEDMFKRMRSFEEYDISDISRLR